DLDVTLPSGCKQFVEWLVNMCLCEDHRRGFIPSMTFKMPAGDKPYWEISAPAIDDNDNKTGKHAVFYSREPTVKAGSTFGRHTRGFPASTELANIESLHLFVKVAWQYSEKGPEQQRSELKFLKRIEKEYRSSGNADIHVPLIQAGGVETVSAGDMVAVPLMTDAVY
ncbi:hypothetical protein GGI04_005959, partial [Coemansia thaxteri]